jgi:hypothetical protein
MFDDSTHTAEEAAAVVGADLGTDRQVARLRRAALQAVASFPIICLVSGRNRVDLGAARRGHRRGPPSGAPPLARRGISRASRSAASRLLPTATTSGSSWIRTSARTPWFGHRPARTPPSSPFRPRHCGLWRTLSSPRSRKSRGSRLRSPVTRDCASSPAGPRPRRRRPLLRSAVLFGLSFVHFGRLRTGRHGGRTVDNSPAQVASRCRTRLSGDHILSSVLNTPEGSSDC